MRTFILIFALFLGVAVNSYSQITPPEPQSQSRPGPPCDPGTGGGGSGEPGGGGGFDPGDGTGVPPPVGLCLPIDDYVYILMGVGVMYGCYKLRDFQVA
ncbi:hypothetical protein [Christiangramia aquimixticola]|uniref:hypothetical protein n=1 Tax=Christiangramia aquimixticola TaxID=1697558 RepID=UPI003AA8E90C